jgi:hypothetical protein
MEGSRDRGNETIGIREFQSIIANQVIDSHSHAGHRQNRSRGGRVPDVAQHTRPATLPGLADALDGAIFESRGRLSFGEQRIERLVYMAGFFQQAGAGLAAGDVLFQAAGFVGVEAAGEVGRQVFLNPGMFRHNCFLSQSTLWKARG